MSLLQPFREAAHDRDQARAAYEAAGQRHLRSALKTARTIQKRWTEPDTVLRRLARWWYLRQVMASIAADTATWEDRIGQAGKQARIAASRLQDAGDDPEAVQAVVEAVRAWEAALALVEDESWQARLAEARTGLARRRDYRDHVRQATEALDALWIARAVPCLEQAVALFPASPASDLLQAATARLEEEKAFEATLRTVAGLQQKGHYAPALRRLQEALLTFPRQDGQDLVAIVARQAKAQTLYDEGLRAEAAGEWAKAERAYRSAEATDPAIGRPQLRQAAVAAATGDWVRVSRVTLQLAGAEIRYLQGYALARQGRYRQAAKAWQPLSGPIDRERQHLLRIVTWQRHSQLQRIHSALAAEDLAAADKACAAYVEAFGPDAWVEPTWHGHVRPRLQRQEWQTGDWQALAAALETCWRREPTLAGLHNWAVALHHLSGSDPRALRLLADVWPSALANAASDPALQDIPWLTGAAPDADTVRTQGMRLLEDRLTATREADPDGYRRHQCELAVDRQAQRLMSERKGLRPTLADMVVLPRLLRRIPDHARRLQMPDAGSNSVEQKLFLALYGDWGTAVAVCLEGHAAGAAEWLPERQPANASEGLAAAYVARSQALAHLQGARWQEAFRLVKAHGNALKAVPEWWRELDTAAGELGEQLDAEQRPDFAREWRQTMGTSAAARLHVTVRVRHVQRQIADEKLTLEAARRELLDLRDLDGSNPLLKELLDLIDRDLESRRLMERIRSRGIEGTYRETKDGGSRMAREVLAEMLARLAVDAMESRRGSPQEVLLMVSMAHDLAPNAPEWQELYRACRL